MSIFISISDFFIGHIPGKLTLNLKVKNLPIMDDHIS